MKENIILVTKDEFSRNCLPTYGNKYWVGKTPNIDVLASKGTVFKNAFTAAPSTAMAFLGFCTGKFSYELEYKKYVPVKNKEKNTIFLFAKKQGYDCHIIWDSRWIYLAKPYSECYDDAKFHLIDNLSQPVGAQFPHSEPLFIDDIKSQNAKRSFEKTLVNIINVNKKIFLWVHFPHVINGRTCIGGDIDLFDDMIGIIRKYFKDDNIFISADHGNMDGQHGKYNYGFDVYNAAIRVPLIVPRIKNIKEYSDPFSTIDLSDLIFKREIKKRDFIYSDSAYYQQPHRKLAIISRNYKYIYNKINNTEELYDYENDPDENCNLMHDFFYDPDRHYYSLLNESHFYPDWNNVYKMRNIFRNEKKHIWRSAGFFVTLFYRIKFVLLTFYHSLKTKSSAKKVHN